MSGTLAGIGVFSVFDGIPTTMEPTWRHRGDCSRSWGRQRQMTNGDETWQTNVKTTGRLWPEATLQWHVSDATQLVGQISRSGAALSSLYDEGQLNWIRSGTRSQWKLASRALL